LTNEKFLVSIRCLSASENFIQGQIEPIAMSKKPPFSLVTNETTVIQPPRQLGQHGMALWHRVQSEFEIRDCGGIEILAQACAALDRAEALAEAIARDGAVIHTRSGIPRAHPGLREELAARAFVCRTLERLGINVEAIKPQGRPGRPQGWTPEIG
jgi:hypothetical protein